MTRRALAATAVLHLAVVLTACEPPGSDQHGVLAPHASPSAAAARGKPNSDVPLIVSIPSMRGEFANQLTGDGRGPYRDGECSVSAVIGNIDPNDDDAAWFRFDPLTERNLRRLQCTPRTYALQLHPSTAVHAGDDPHEDSTLGALGLLSTSVADEATVAFLYEFYGTATGTTVTTRGNIAVAFCRAADGRGAPLRFNPQLGPGSDLLEVSHTSAGEWRVRTQPFPNNKAWCEHHKSDGSTIELLLHVDLEYGFSEIA